MNNSVRFQFHKGTIKPTSPEAGSNFHSDFNSIKVRLNLANLLLTLMVLLYFNSIKVRLNLCLLNLLASQLRDFNSIKVRLNPLTLLWHYLTFLHFNSIKVRLKLIHYSYRYSYEEFQFHKGTIKTLSLIHI